HAGHGYGHDAAAPAAGRPPAGPGSIQPGARSARPQRERHQRYRYDRREDSRSVGRTTGARTDRRVAAPLRRPVAPEGRARLYRSAAEAILKLPTYRAANYRGAFSTRVRVVRSNPSWGPLASVRKRPFSPTSIPSTGWWTNLRLPTSSVALEASTRPIKS